MSDSVRLTYHGRIALITLNQPKKLNALNQDLYYQLACHMREVAARDDIFITVLTGKGRYFSAGADVSGSNQPSERRAILRSFAANNLEVTNAFYTHPKILVTALNGPVIGLSAALIAFSDFIYATPSTFLLTPFTSLGLVSEGATSFSLVQRLGISRANEALIMSKRLTSSELLAAGFVNKVFDDVRDGEDEKFLGLVWKEVEDRLGEHLNQDSLIKVKELIRKPYREVLDRQNAEEILAGVERFVKGEPQKEFSRIARGEKRHKL